MFTIDSFVLYVSDVQDSMDFYAKAFNCEPSLLSPTFAALDFADNVKITLKQTTDLTPKSEVKGGGTELSMPIADKETFDKLFSTWKSKGIEFAQEIEASVFGFNFVAVDPDGHRIRIFTH
ncbi:MULTISPECIES: VOC family protein [unclassified Agarivorans]|uniref:VOC family protein n=1 Tax=unclassified Agarivorans TaxID=2636026 RepID=UPI0026E44050|nr:MULTISPECIES: VOC family protein [unclassified Agarivorans]MDO6686124.1 VOC family protein [Agarivorans sp. 3_MG-2023]MDO6716427.1 VOC family protein [Agarivorans sp. 2_MG-2023]